MQPFAGTYCHYSASGFWLRAGRASQFPLARPDDVR
jgi:hypothetical protein